MRLPAARTTSSVLALVAIAAATTLTGCDPTSSSSASASASATAPGSASPSATPAARSRALLEAEVTRRIEQVTDEDLRSPEVVVRRAAYRALARSRDERAYKALLQGLADHDPVAVAWAAYGLGDLCAGRREVTAQALTAAVASARSRFAPIKGDERPTPSLSPHVAIAHALGRCGTAATERTLVAIAREHGPGARAAVLALGRVADQRERLREDSYVALLSLAEGDAIHPAMPEALYPIGRVEHLTPSVIERTHRLAEASLAEAGPYRVFAVTALGRVDGGAVETLAEVAKDGVAYTPAERAAAVEALKRFPRKGQDALASIIGALAASLGEKLAVEAPEVPLLLRSMEALTVVKGAMADLKQLAALEPPDGASPALRRRISWLRCTAAAVVAERKYDHPLLRACDLSVDEEARKTDPIPSSIGARAVVRAIGVDGVSIRGARLHAWRAYALDGERRARQEALELLRDHAEIRESAATLTKALEEDEPGYVATAAQIIADRPLRAIKRELQEKKKEDDEVGAAELHPALVAALVERLEPGGPTEDLEALGAVVDAVGALRLQEAKAALLDHCRSPWPTIRQKTQQALAAIMGRAAPQCDAVEPLARPVELDRLVTEPTRLTLKTDVGEVSVVLDPDLAPLAVTRFVELAKNDFFDGLVVHRVVPGFVTQLGSPTGDGYGGVKGLPALPCETSPVHFGALSVGVALAGRDTGSSQLFVTHAPTPRLTGEYPLMGRAEGPWATFVDGDQIEDVIVEKVE